MRSKNIIKILPVVLLLTACNQSVTTKEITREEFEKSAKSLKNDYATYSSIKETFKTEKVEAKTGIAKDTLDSLIKLLDSVPGNKMYEEGYTYSEDIYPSYIYTTLGYYQNPTYQDLTSTYYSSSNNKLSCKFLGETSSNNINVKVEFYFYFNESGLEEYFDLNTTQTYSDNSTLYTSFRTTYTWNK